MKRWQVKEYSEKIVETKEEAMKIFKKFGIEFPEGTKRIGCDKMLGNRWVRLKARPLPDRRWKVIVKFWWDR